MIKNIWSKLPVCILFLVMASGCSTDAKVGVVILWWANTEEALEVHYKITNDSEECTKNYMIDISFHVQFDDGTDIGFLLSNISLPREGESTTNTMFLPISPSEQEKVINVICDWDLQCKETVALLSGCDDCKESHSDN